MRIAITADVHLTQDQSHPERMEAFAHILDRLEEMEIDTLVVAGDLFDISCTSYAGFEKTCRLHPGISIHVIPGNHDPDISDRTVVGENVHIYEETAVLDLDGLFLVLVPYSDTSGMAESLEGLDLTHRWVLVGHGDYLSGAKAVNTYEAGTYMPLYRRDIERFRPWKVFLGHIHQPPAREDVHYPGSPCGIDVNETGRRHFLIFDTETGKISRQRVESGLLFFREKFLVIPDENELERLRSQAEARSAAWGLDAAERPRARIRIAASGYTSDREAVLECLRESFSGYVFYRGEGPDISMLLVARDTRRNAIARRTMEIVDELDWEYGGLQPDKDQIIEAALNVIFGEGRN